MVTAVIVAAGRGQRLSGRQEKPFVKLAGRPLLAYSVELFDSHPGIDAVVVVAAADRLERVRRLLPTRRYRKLAALVAGGSRRRDSVAAALAVLPTGSRVVLVHDAARPLASPELLSRLIKAGRRQAAVPGLPVSDAVWKAAAGRCERPVARDGMFQVQTPQAFPVRVIRAAYASGRTGGGRADDDAALARRAGFPVRLLPGEPTNFKITYPADLAAAEAFLRARPKPGQKGKGRCLTR